MRKTSPYQRTKEQPKEIFMSGLGGISKVVKSGMYRVGQWIADGIFYAGENKKKK